PRRPAGTDQPPPLPDQPGGQQHQRDRGDALPPPVAGPGLARAEPARTLERSAQLVQPRAVAVAAARIARGADVAHAPAPRAKNQIARVNTTVSTATVHPEA